jgi:periplasmic protein TonB
MSESGVNQSGVNENEAGQADAVVEATPSVREPAYAPSILDVEPARSKSGPVVAGLGAVTLHIGVVVLATAIGSASIVTAVNPLRVSEMIEVEIPAPPPPPEPEPEPPKAAPPPVAKAAPKPAEPPPQAAPPPAAAQAAQVLDAPSDVVDFGDTFVAGQGTSYAGGTTESGGTSKTAVRSPSARAAGVIGGTGTDVKGDLSRKPRLAGGLQWDCPFPAEADDFGVDHAAVTLRVEVGADGRVTLATATTDPGHGFAREARRCALSKRWQPGLDRAGNAINDVAVINVRFDR